MAIRTNDHDVFQTRCCATISRPRDWLKVMNLNAVLREFANPFGEMESADFATVTAAGYSHSAELRIAFPLSKGNFP